MRKNISCTVPVPVLPLSNTTPVDEASIPMKFALSGSEPANALMAEVVDVPFVITGKTVLPFVVEV